MTHRLTTLIVQSSLWAGLLLGTGCTTSGVIGNSQKILGTPDPDNYSLKSKTRDSNETLIALTFSGGGTRAAALAYGVMQELRDTRIQTASGPASALDEVDSISSVSGGSFTAAYYGLFGPQLFDDYEELFLRKNIERRLIRRMFLNPLQWFSRIGRTEQAVRYYQKHIFQDATYADMVKQEGPLILINTSDLGHGVRFSFIQEYFDLLNSDISSFPVARAVTASSAVPVLFDPIVLKNYPEAKAKKTPPWLARLDSVATLGNQPQLEMIKRGITGYFNRTEQQYVHLVDGGITDNLGLRAMLDIVELSGGASSFYEEGKPPPRRFAVISVNASAKKSSTVNEHNIQPSLKATIEAITDIQMQRYNISTLQDAQLAVHRWCNELSTPEKPVSPYFIQIRFDDVTDPQQRQFLNEVPTSFDLTDEQVDALIQAGRNLLRNNPTFKDLLMDIKKH